MKRFLQIYCESIEGVVHGFDRLILKGHIRHFYFNNNFYYFLAKENVQLKDFKTYVTRVTEDIKAHIKKIISQTGCYFEYL